MLNATAAPAPPPAIDMRRLTLVFSDTISLAPTLPIKSWVFSRFIPTRTDVDFPGIPNRCRFRFDAHSG